MALVSITLPQNPYNIDINPIDKLSFDNKVAIITNPKISGLHINYLMSKITAKEIYIITISDGEEYKNNDTIDFILNQLFTYQFDRKSTLIAFGGGIVGDITGFVASMYQRGIDFIQIPTTLLAQVDSSVGGKTGINNKFGKNLIGAFNQPKAVYIDIHFLSTLEKREYQAGICEIIKMAICFDKDFFEFLCNNDLYKIENIKYAIEKSVQIKAKVVIEDEKENTIRAKLNYGHTFAHIIEKQTSYTTYLHGEAVSIGIIMANTLALSLSLITQDEFNKIKNILSQYNLPITYNIENIDIFYNQFFLDKKSINSKIKFILPIHIGDSCIKDNIDEKSIKEVLKKF
jgi:3-dehydroquinate synthase